MNCKSATDPFQHFRISMQMQYDKPTQLMMGWQYPKRQLSAQIKNNTASRPALLRCSYSLHRSSCSPCVHRYLTVMLISYSFSAPPLTIPSPPGENSSSTFTLLFTLHCRKGLQSGAMEGGCSARQSIFNQCIIRKFPDK